MALGWINPNDYSFNSFLLMERFQIHYFMDPDGWHMKDAEWRRCMGIALNANPAVVWYLAHRCPERAELIDALAASAPADADAAQIRAAEVFVLEGVEDFTIYTTPERMDTQCDFIYGWDRARLFEMADFAGKTVLDVGSGSGRLAFAAAQRAKEVYASEPVGTLREFIRDKAAREGIANIRVAEALLPFLPYPDDTFDIVMEGHVVGDDWDAEVAELARVCKPGGWLLDCPGDSTTDMKPKGELLKRGWESMHYVGSFGKDVFRHRKQVLKP